MTARDKYIAIFGKLYRLDQKVPSWSMGVSNMFEWLTWSTETVLGVSKTQYRKKIVEWTYPEAAKGASIATTQEKIAAKIDEEMSKNEHTEVDSPASPGIVSPREALRRAKFFSEDYLNKEFDIFWSLVSDKYLDQFYAKFTNVSGGGTWFNHGNSGLFKKSTGLREMQMDNLSYNPNEELLVANELKLGGKKNRDQILKYALMYRRLRDEEFIKPNTRFLILFLGDTNIGPMGHDVTKIESAWPELVEEEVAFCRASTTSTAKEACRPENIRLANDATKGSINWQDLMEFNKEHLAKLDLTTQQVERKLLLGFNETLESKVLMRRARRASEHSAELHVKT